MKTIGAMILTFCTIAGISNACIEFIDHETYIIDESGYIEL